MLNLPKPRNTEAIMSGSESATQRVVVLLMVLDLEVEMCLEYVLTVGNQESGAAELLLTGLSEELHGGRNARPMDYSFSITSQRWA